MLLTGGAVVSRGCSCLNCTNQFEGTCHFVGAVETTAPPGDNCTPWVRKLNHTFKFSVCKVTKYVNKL